MYTVTRVLIHGEKLKELSFIDETTAKKAARDFVELQKRIRQCAKNDRKYKRLSASIESGGEVIALYR